jgi:hypothetical protein
MSPGYAQARIDALLIECQWLQARVHQAPALFAARMTARLEAIARELRALHTASDGHAVVCWTEGA